MKMLRTASCFLAAGLFLTACTGPAPQDSQTAGPGESAAKSSAPGPEQNSGSPAPVPSAGPETAMDTTPGSSGSKTGSQEPVFTPARLESAVTAVNTRLELDGEVLAEETLRAVLPEESATRGVTFEPAECAEIAAGESISAVQDAALAGLAFGPAGQAPSVLNVAAYKDSSVLDTLDYLDSAVLSGCSAVRMSKDGEEVTVTNTNLDLTTAAEETLALDTAVSGSREQTRIVVVSARTGNVRIVVTTPAPQDARAAAENAGAVIDALLAELGLAVR